MRTPHSPASSTGRMARLLRFLTRIAVPGIVALALGFASVPARAQTNATDLLVVVGAPGETQFGSNFVAQAEAWVRLGSRIQARTRSIGLDAPGTNDLEQLQSALGSLATNGASPLLLVFIGHGTHDGRDARFNLRGPDVTATNLLDWLRPITRPTAILNTASASAPFLKVLSRSNRVVVTATRSGNEVNATRLGAHLATALEDPKADLDQDGDVSVLEAFLSAATRTAESYKAEGRLATEHPLIDDNADTLGTPADWFRGTRATKKPQGGAAPDGLKAHQFALIPGTDSARLTPEQRARRDELEAEILRLRESRPEPPDDAYYAKLESLLLEIARLSTAP